MKTKTCQKQMKKKKKLESKKQHFRGVHNQVFYHTVALTTFAENFLENCISPTTWIDNVTTEPFNV
jgi:hypothetical protein